ncbi:Cadherin-related family member 5 [Liparis tanakae]|uniref:Cadherin-related family member 5 n=1 Tax=Liparis tanakae TaxID=230148 RepID=A0A4Z2FUG4_9TELE|nr:Cadherin-related family member 5 [Liparis tanakae]
MDGIRPRTSVCFLLLLVLLRTSNAAICSAEQPVNFSENNKVDDIVTTITVQPNVSLLFRPPPANPDNPFRLDENRLIATEVLDYENQTTHNVDIICTDTTTGREFSLIILVLVSDVNDNPPVFAQNPYHVSVNETGFTLKSPNNPELLVQTALNYEKVKSVELTLTAQDAVLAGVSSTATTTIVVTILDGDNRPPWFQPCIRHEVAGAVICQSSGYTGHVVQNEQQDGVLPLKPGPLHAIDGDSGINGEVTYSFLNGDADGLFEIHPDTGNITMLKPADVLETVLRLTVLATQRTNSYQFATTGVTVSVLVKSLHRPRFQRPVYEAVVSAVGVIATDAAAEGKPLTILAMDDDYAAGINPNIAYSVNGSVDFSVVGGYLFMTTELPEGALSLQLLAVDATNGETAEARLSVEVTAAPAGFGPLDMAALGAPLGVLLLACLVVIVALALRLRRVDADQRKILEASVFQSSLAHGGPKGSVQYTNEAFQHDHDGDSVGSGGPAAGDFPVVAVMAAVPLRALPRGSIDADSHAGSDSADGEEKEVKPILTKERRVDDGYKSVWFKEDIDPDAKEEVLIIPDSREDDSEEEDEEPSSSGREDDEDDEDDGRRGKTSRVFFNEADLDSGLGVKMEDPDSEGDEALTAHL